MSSTMTCSSRNAAVPHEPAFGPISEPSIASQYSTGRCGAAPWCSVFLSSSNIRTDARIVGIWCSMRKMSRSSAACIVAPLRRSALLRVGCPSANGALVANSIWAGLSANEWVPMVPPATQNNGWSRLLIRPVSLEGCFIPHKRGQSLTRGLARGSIGTSDGARPSPAP
jgi:hypothetical protein